MSFNIGLSGIRAASKDLEVTGNNIANASTTGFKESRAEFSDVYTTTLLGTGTKPTGGGVDVSNIRQEFSQGNISGTGNALDMAVDGNGFFVLKNQGVTSYTRAGLFSLDKEGYVTASSGARVQGFEANQNGLVNGVLGDLQIQVGNQSPALTNRVSAIFNLDAGENVLQEQGLKIDTKGLAIGTPVSGIIKSTTSTLAAVGQPTDQGTPSMMQWANTAAAVAAAATPIATITIDIGQGPKIITLPAQLAGQSESQLLSAIQAQLDNPTTGFGTQELKATTSTAPVAGGVFRIERAGIDGTNGSTFTATPDAAWTAAFGANGGVLPGVTGAKLFVGTTPQIADFRSIPGTSTTTRTTTPPPLSIAVSNAGTFARLTANNAYANLNVTTASTNALAFNVGVEGLATPYPVNLRQASWIGAAPANFNSVTVTEAVAQINLQIQASATPTPTLADARVVATNNAGKIELTVKGPATQGQFVQIVDNTGASSTYNLTNLGFVSSNRLDAGTDPVQANNQFRLAVTSTTGGAAGPFDIVIPPKTYATVEDLALAVQQQVDVYIGASGLNGKVKVSAVGGQLVFTNTKVGAGEGIAITASTGLPAVEAAASLNALKLSNLFTVAGQNSIDKTNSFRISLTIPAPDADKRSGSVLVKLDESYRSVQQLAASINRQINSQTGDAYVGVRAQATEIEPKVSPPEFQLELLGVKEGEASIIKISDVTAGGPDISAEEMFALLQTDPGNNGLLTTGIEGVNNKYPEQKVTITNPDKEKVELTIPKGSEANEIASLFNKQPGITASATSQLTIPLANYKNPTGTMKITVNGQELKATTLPEIAKEIATFRSTTLPGFKAEVNAANDLVITNEIGRDIKIEIASPNTTDSLVVTGAPNTGPVVLGGSASADRAAAVGGTVAFTLNKDYTLSEPNPTVSGVFGALSADEFTAVTLNSFDPKDQKTYNHATSTTIYDSLGNEHTMTQYFVKEPADPKLPNEKNIWAMYVQVDGREVGDPDTKLAFPANLEPTRKRFELFFNQDGTLDTTATGDMFITNWDPVDSKGVSNGALTSKNVLESGLPLATPATNSNFQISLDGSTQFASKFSVSELTQNGYATGRLAGLEVNTNGTIFARYTNGQAQTLGQVALANFRAPEGLTPLGGTGWAESFESGVATVGSPRTGSFGQLRSSSLEASNVDLSEELVGLILAQRNYQASAKTIETANQLTQTILNI